MRSLIVAGLATVTVAALGCSEQTTPTTADQALGRVAEAGAQPAQTSRHFVAPLRGGAEVPPISTAGVGTAGFNIRAGGEEIEFMQLIGRLFDLNQAHIHLGPAGTNGPVVVWLYPEGPPPVHIPGEFNGVLSEGVFDADALVGPLAGQPLSALIEEMRAGNTYVNVHTLTYPGGEIRGQIIPITVID